MLTDEDLLNFPEQLVVSNVLSEVVGSYPKLPEGTISVTGLTRQVRDPAKLSEFSFLAENGSVYHAGVAAHLEGVKGVLMLERQLEVVFPEGKIQGTVDLVVDAGDSIVVIDHKTTADYRRFQMFLDDGASFVPASYVFQLNAYAYMIRKMPSFVKSDVKLAIHAVYTGANPKLDDVKAMRGEDIMVLKSTPTGIPTRAVCPIPLLQSDVVEEYMKYRLRGGPAAFFTDYVKVEDALKAFFDYRKSEDKEDEMKTL